MSDGKREPAANPPRAAVPAPEGSRVLDPAALKAYAHPLRIAILRRLNDHGPATATTLARHLGESTGQTSYHLRQLARHGIVEDVPGRGTGRERWWQAKSVTIDAATMLEDESTAAAAGIVLGATVAERARTLSAWLGSVTGPDRSGWPDSALHLQSTMWLTAEELAEVSESLAAVVTATGDRFRDRRNGPVPDGARLVRVYLDAFPLAEEAESD